MINIIAEPQNRLKLIIISGFLGAGKTTFLQHYLSSFNNRASHVFVNEVAEYSIDDLLLSNAKIVTKITGGCVCCSKKTVFLEMLHSLCNLKTCPPYFRTDRTDRILLETSGISDPKSIYEGIVNDRILSKHIFIEKIIVVLDGSRDLNDLHREALIKDQILSADEIFISKCDLIEDKKIHSIVSQLISLNPMTKINGSVKGQIKDILYQKNFTQEEFMPSQKNLELNTVEKVFTMKILLNHNTKWSSLVIWLSALLYCHGRRILRVKGVVNSPAGPLLLQGVGEYIQKPQILPKTFESQEKYLILILRDMNRDEILSSIKFVYNE